MDDLSQQPVVSVFGANDPKPGDDEYAIAFDVGKILAELGYTIANGGYGGTMEASAAGAKAADGATVGVTCSVWSSTPNQYIDEIIVTSQLLERVGKLIELGTGGYVVLPGATGTLAELAWVWELACKGFNPGPNDGRSIVCVGEFWQPLIDMMAVARPASSDCIALITSPDAIKDHFARL